jgi:hypothetical protein
MSDQRLTGEPRGMTPFSASPETTNRIVRPLLDDDMRRALRHARIRRRRRQAQRVLTRA